MGTALPGIVEACCETGAAGAPGTAGEAGIAGTEGAGGACGTGRTAAAGVGGTAFLITGAGGGGAGAAGGIGMLGGTGARACNGTWIRGALPLASGGRSGMWEALTTGVSVGWTSTACDATIGVGGAA